MTSLFIPAGRRQPNRIPRRLPIDRHPQPLPRLSHLQPHLNLIISSLQPLRQGDLIRIDYHFSWPPARRGIRAAARHGVRLPDATRAVGVQHVDEDGIVRGRLCLRLPDKFQRVCAVPAAQVVAGQGDLLAERRAGRMLERRQFV